MRFKTDENLHPEVAEFLRERGHDVATVWDEDLRGRSDAELAEACRRESRVLITLDVDFGDIMAYPPEQYAGLIVLRVGEQSRRRVLEVMARVISMLEDNPPTGRLWIVDERQVRQRGGEAGD